MLINILKGDMAIIGPRPALWNQYDLIEMRASSGVHKFVPGLTGLAQISGRDELEIPEEKQRELLPIIKQNYDKYFHSSESDNHSYLSDNKC